MLDVDVLIVGGGATGLTASMLLSTYGIGTHLVSKYPSTSTLPKAHLLSIKTMEIFREVGVEDAIRAMSCPDENMRYVGWYAGLAGEHPDAGRRIALFPACGRGRQDHEWLGVSDNSYTNLTQSRLEPMMKARAEELAPGTVHFNRQLVTFVETPDGVVADIEDRDTGQIYQVRARYLLACDGGRTVNPLVGVEMEGHSAVATNISVHFSADLSRWAKDPEVLIRTIFNPDLGYPCVLVPMGPETWGPGSTEWVFHLMSFPGDHKTWDEATAVAEMKKGLGVPGLEPDVHMVSYWPLDAVVATRFRVGRAFILGDAAHRNPPAGGHGLNTGVQDAYNLCWKLAAALRGQADDTLLDSYEAERRPLAQRTVAEAWSNWQNGKKVAEGFGFSPANAREQNWRNLELLWGDGPDADAARRRGGEGLTAITPTYNSLELNFGHAYEEGAIVKDGTTAPPLDGTYHPSTRPGQTVPHAWLENLDGATSLNALIAKGRFTLIVGEEAVEWRDAAEAVAHRRGIPLDAFVVGVKSGDWFDNRQEWARRRQVGPAGAVLVRPDRFVAWRTDSLPDDPQATLDAVFDAILFGVSGDAPTTARSAAARGNEPVANVA